MMDPDWTPSGTSFGLNCSPWLMEENSRTCVISFVDRNYVGFRKLTIQGPWERGSPPTIQIDDKDVFGRCLYLMTDSFVEFEDAVSGSSSPSAKKKNQR